MMTEVRNPFKLPVSVRYLDGTAVLEIDVKAGHLCVGMIEGSDRKGRRSKDRTLTIGVSNLKEPFDRNKIGRLRRKTITAIVLHDVEDARRIADKINHLVTIWEQQEEKQ